MYNKNVKKKTFEILRSKITVLMDLYIMKLIAFVRFCLNGSDFNNIKTNFDC